MVFVGDRCFYIRWGVILHLRLSIFLGHHFPPFSPLPPHPSDSNKTAHSPIPLFLINHSSNIRLFREECHCRIRQSEAETKRGERGKEGEEEKSGKEEENREGKKEKKKREGKKNKKREKEEDEEEEKREGKREGMKVK